MTEMATVLVDGEESAMFFARTVRTGDKFVLPERCSTAKVVYEFLRTQPEDTVFEVDGVHKLKVKAGFFFVKDREGRLCFNPVSFRTEFTNICFYF